MEWSLKIDCDTCKCGFLSQTFKIDKAAAAGRLFTWLRTLDHRTPLKGDTYIDCQLYSIVYHIASHCVKTIQCPW